MRELFGVPSLTEEDLKPYLLRSRATSAYDAVTLLAWSVGVAFDQGEDNCTETSVIRTALEGEFMVRNSKISINISNNISKFCLEFMHATYELAHYHTHLHTPPCTHTHMHTHKHTHAQECEYCRIHPGCSFNATEQCQKSCPWPGPYYSTPGTTSIAEMKSGNRNSKSDNITHFFGQILYTQFIGKING